MPAITIHRRDLLHPADERDVWVNLVGHVRDVRGMSLEDFVVEMTCATRSTGTWGAHTARVTCVLDLMPAKDVRRLAHAILVENGASAEVEWAYEIAPQPVERLGVSDPRALTRTERVLALLARLRRRRW